MEPRPSHIDYLRQLVDYASATTQYIGYAAPGSATSAAVWQIRRLTLDNSSRITAVDWAGSTTDFTQVWNSRNSLQYG